MDSNEIMDELLALQSEIKQVESAEKEWKKANSRYCASLSLTPQRVAQYDAEHKESYIVTQIGPAPEKPKAIAKLAYPIYIAHKKAYDLYQEEYKKAEGRYYELFKLTRDSIQKEEEAQISQEREIAKAIDKEAANNLLNAREILANNNFLSKELKNKYTVSQIIGYFQNHRVDSIKEAVNLYYEEEHRRKLEKLAKDQVKLAKNALNRANDAYELAERALDISTDAISQANSAYDRANAAYAHADDAYDMAYDAKYSNN